ncbi:hypothetical protein D3C84_1203430 [compost metagenome]
MIIAVPDSIQKAAQCAAFPVIILVFFTLQARTADALLLEDVGRYPGFGLGQPSDYEGRAVH